MPELDEPRTREIVRDELSVLQIPQRLAAIEATLEHKADKADVEKLRGEMKGDINALKVEQQLTRDFMKTNFRIVIGIGIAILLLLIKDSFL